MRYLFLLSRENVSLACAEVLNLAKYKSYKLIDNILVLECSKSEIRFLSNRLAYTRLILRVLFICRQTQLNGQVNKFNWQRIYSKSFGVKIIGKSSYSEAELGSLIKRNLRNANINLESPGTLINFLFFNKIVTACKLEFVLEGNFRSRSAHKRPRNHPSSLDPKLARCLVNLTGVRNGNIIDPMCGIGGILIEASLCGLNIIGYDIDPEMVDRARENLKYFGIKKFKLGIKDALRLKKADNMVTDLPYGRNTKNIDKKLYFDFFKNIKIKKSVVVFPKFKDRVIDYKQILSEFRIINSFEIYIHKTLSKKIFIIDMK